MLANLQTHAGLPPHYGAPLPGIGTHTQGTAVVVKRWSTRIETGLLVPSVDRLSPFCPTQTSFKSVLNWLGLSSINAFWAFASHWRWAGCLFCRGILGVKRGDGAGGFRQMCGGKQM